MTGTKIVWLAMIVASLCLCGCSQRVVHVIDGDTVILDNQEHVRLLGIDCPEMSCFQGQAYREYVVRLVEGKPIKIIRKGRDKYNRTLGWIYINGRNLSNILIEKGCRRWK